MKTKNTLDKEQELKEQELDKVNGGAAANQKSNADFCDDDFESFAVKRPQANRAGGGVSK